MQFINPKEKWGQIIIIFCNIIAFKKNTKNTKNELINNSQL